MRSAAFVGAILIACAACDAPQTSTQPLDDNENLVMGNPSNAKVDAETSPDNFLVARKQFALSYNNSQKIPNWVSWHQQELDRHHGQEGRVPPGREAARLLVSRHAR